MKCLCLIRADKMMEHLESEDAAQHYRDYKAFTDAIKASGQFIGANRLLPPETATTVRVRDGRVLTTDWVRLQTAPSPVIALNRAMAMAFGAAAGLDLVDALRTEPTLAQYHLLPAVRGDLLMQLDCHPEARAEFERAATLAANASERALLLRRAATCRSLADGDRR
jgi:hypothetical protein